MKIAPAPLRHWLQLTAVVCLTASSGCTSVIGSAYLREAWLDAVEHAAETQADAKSAGKSGGKAARADERTVDDSETAAGSSAVSDMIDVSDMKESSAAAWSPATLDEAVSEADHRLAHAGGLSEAATLGRDFFAGQGFERVIVAHGDLPFCEELSSLGFDQPAARVLLAPCHRTDGTNICSVPARAAFEFSYGPGSFARHKAEVERLGLELEVVTRDDLAFDVDTPEDLANYNARKSS